MSELRVNTVSPRTATAVNITGLEVPSYLGQPLALDSDVVDTNVRIDNLNASTISAGDPASLFSTSTIQGQIEEIALGFASQIPGYELGDFPSFAPMIKVFYRLSNPVGKVVQGYFATAPLGTIELDGTEYNRTGDMADLWSYVNANSLAIAHATWSTSDKTMFSLGDGSTTFRVPDLRGYYLRNWDHSRGIDSGRTLGSYQADALQNVTGTFGAVHGASSAATGPFAEDGVLNAHITADVVGTDPAWTFDLSRAARTAAETRVKSVALMVCMYY